MNALSIAASLAALLVVGEGLRAQTSIDPILYTGDCTHAVRAYVEVSRGDDTTALVGVARLPFQTLQAAIDAVYIEVQNRLATDPLAFGVVHALPGVYGPTGNQANTDLLPILMRDRVNVRGAGARRCVIRGDGNRLIPVFWPDGPTCGTQGVDREVLVDFSFAPWSGGNPDYAEGIDGFTFMGGDVQVLVRSEAPVTGAVSNCIFDMRHGQLPGHGAVGGPFIGVFSYQIWDLSVPGYRSNDFNILNNTFVMGESVVGEPEAPAARDEAVAILDVNDPLCNAGVDGDPDPQLRGVSRLSIQNNLIRTLTTQDNIVMLGVGVDDVVAAVGNTTDVTRRRSNAFRGTRVGPPSNLQGTLWSARPTTQRPSPVVDLDVTDPGFVGEVLRALTAALPVGYRDYRVVFDSTLVDRGVSPVVSNGALRIQSGSGTSYLVPSCADVSAFQWDGESHGNPRVVGGLCDIGFDEVHFMVMAGSWSNQDASHHNPPTLLNPNVTTAGQATRHVLVPATQVGANLRVQAITALPVLTVPAGQLPGWIRQRGTISPTVVAGLPIDLDTAYIDINATLNATNWDCVVFTATVANPLSGQLHLFGFAVDVNTGLPITDPDAIGSAGVFFNVQGTIRDGSGAVQALSNLQSEYR